MEKQILEIMKEYRLTITCVQEIAKLFREFTEWKDDSLQSRVISYNYYNGYYIYGERVFYTIDDIFTYWFDNIKDK